METYSPSMATAVRQELAQASPEYLAQLVPYYQQRRGPGLVLLEEEHRRRGFPFPPDGPRCGQQRNRCSCLPFLTH